MHTKTKILIAVTAVILTGVFVVAQKSQATDYRFTVTSTQLLTGSEQPVTSQLAAATADGTNTGWKAVLADDGYHWKLAGANPGGLNAQFTIGNASGIGKIQFNRSAFRSSKAIPRLIAEGFSKKHQKSGFQKYIDDAHSEANETIVSIEQCRDFYNVNAQLCSDLSDKYDKIARQLFNLAEAWDKFKNRRRIAPSA